MFGGLRQGGLLYLLSKDANGAELRIGTIESVSNPQPKYGQAQVQMYGQTEMYVDVKVKCGEEVFELKQLPTSQNITSSNGLVVADNKEAMSAEVEAMQRTSRQILDSIELHQMIVEKCDVMLRELNPQFAKEMAREEKIGALEGKMSGIEDALSKIQDMLSSVLSHPPTNNKKSKEE